MNAYLLERSGIIRHIEEHIKQFFLINEGSACTSIVSVAFKAYIRGIFIAFEANSFRMLLEKSLWEREIMDWMNRTNYK